MTNSQEIPVIHRPSTIRYKCLLNPKHLNLNHQMVANDAGQARIDRYAREWGNITLARLNCSSCQ